jgi:hypothetical protein
MHQQEIDKGRGYFWMIWKEEDKSLPVLRELTLL